MGMEFYSRENNIMEKTCNLPQLRKRYPSLTPVEKWIADYVQKTPSRPLSLSAAALADGLVAAISVLRFDTAISWSGQVHDLLENLRYRNKERK